jgi:hypothetical protein
MRWLWPKLFSYAEVMCFITAWAVGLLIARGEGRAADERGSIRTFATAADLPGVQASLRR